LTLIDARGEPAARAREEFRCGWCCSRSFVAEGGGAAGGGVHGGGGDEYTRTSTSSTYEHQEYYRIRTSECGTSRGHNVCAPSCFNASYDMDVYDASELNVVARSANVWPGCNCAGATDRSNIVLRFPRDADPKRRAALVAATMLVEFAHFEWRKDGGEGAGVMML